MLRKNVEDALKEAKRFVKVCQDAVNKKDYFFTDRISYSKESAACKRASMDLTRALAKMRTSWQRES